MKSKTTALRFEVLEMDWRNWWRLWLLWRQSSRVTAGGGRLEGRGMGGRWWKEMEGAAAETAAMYCWVAGQVPVGGVRMRMVTEIEGWWVAMSFPSSTVEIRCPLSRAGYRTMESFMMKKMKVVLLLCSDEITKMNFGVMKLQDVSKLYTRVVSTSWLLND